MLYLHNVNNINHNVYLNVNLHSLYCGHTKTTQNNSKDRHIFVFLLLLETVLHLRSCFKVAFLPPKTTTQKIQQTYCRDFSV